MIKLLLLLLCLGCFGANAQLPIDQAFVFDGHNDVWTRGLGIDADDNKYVAACHSSWIEFPALNQKIKAPGHVGTFVVKIDAKGKYQWVIPMQGERNCRIQEMSVADDGTVAVTGYFTGKDLWVNGKKLPTQAEAKHNLANPAHVFIAVFNRKGKLIWHKIYKAAQGSGMGIVIDKDHNVYAWLSYHKALKGPGIDKEDVDLARKDYQQSNELLVKYDAKGKLLLQKEYPHKDNRFHVGKRCFMLCDAGGNLYVAYPWRGTFNFGNTELKNDGLHEGSDYFVCRFGPNLEPVWINSIGGENNQDVTSMSWGPDNRMLIAGTYSFECSIGSGAVVPLQTSGFEYKAGTSLFMCKMDLEGGVSSVKFQQGEGYNGYFTSNTMAVDAQGITHSFGFYLRSFHIQNSDGPAFTFGDPTDDDDYCYYATWKDDSLDRFTSMGNVLPHGGFEYSATRNGWLWATGVNLAPATLWLRDGSSFELTKNHYGNSGFLIGSRIDPETDEPNDPPLLAIETTEEEVKEPQQEVTPTPSVTKAGFKVDLFPNPTPDVVNLNIEGLDEVQLYFMDLNGKVLLAHRATFKAAQQQLRFDVSSLAPGTYVVVVNAPNAQESLRFVKL